MSDCFEVDFTRFAEKNLKALRNWMPEIFRHTSRLETDPHTGHHLKGSPKGSRSLEFNLRGSGAYRAVYVVDAEERICTDLLIASHESVYQEAEQRVKALRKAGEIRDFDQAVFQLATVM